MIEPIDAQETVKTPSAEHTQGQNLASNRRQKFYWQRFLLVQGLGCLGGIGILSSSIAWTQDISPSDTTVTPVAPSSLRQETPQARPGRAAAGAGRRLRSKLRRNRNQTTAANNNNYIDPTDYSLGATRRRTTVARNYDAPNTVILTERDRGNPTVPRIRPRVRNRVDSDGIAVTSIPRSRISRYVRPSRIARTPEISRRVSRIRPDRIARTQPSVREQNLSRRTPITRVRRTPQIPIETTARTINPSRIARPTTISRSRRSRQIPIDTVASIRTRSNSVRDSFTSPIATPTSISNLRDRSRRVWGSRNRGTAIASTAPVQIGAVGDNTSDMRVRHSNGIGIQGAINPSNKPSPTWPGLAYNTTPNAPQYPSSRRLPIIFPLPIPSQITSVFGWRVHPVAGDVRFHSGTDIGAPIGTPVLAAYAGRVALANTLSGYGLTVILQHNDATQETRYAHLSEVFVQPGDFVEQGAIIGRVGNTGTSTGPHLHFEVREQTPEGWVATDPGNSLEFGLAQLIRAMQIAQAPQSNPTQNNTPSVPVAAPIIESENVQLPEIVIPATPTYFVSPNAGG